MARWAACFDSVGLLLCELKGRHNRSMVAALLSLNPVVKLYMDAIFRARFEEYPVRVAGDAALVGRVVVEVLGCVEGSFSL